MQCNKCGAENQNSKFCMFCGAELDEVLAMQVMKTYLLTGRGFMANGIAQIGLKANDIVKNSRTKKSFVILYIVNKKFKMSKGTEVNQEYTLCLSGAVPGDFEPGDNLVI